MAKNKNLKVAENDPEDGVNGEGTEGTENESKKGGKAIELTLEDGTVVKRADYIRKRWTEDKISRGAIAKELSALQGKEVPYQIVFAATKGIAGGPDKVAAEGDAAEA